MSFAFVLAAAFVVSFALGSGFDPAETDAGAGHGEATHSDPAGQGHRETLDGKVWTAQFTVAVTR